MSAHSCSSCGRVVWQSEKFCSGCRNHPDFARKYCDLFLGESGSPRDRSGKRKCPRCGRKCRCVAVLFLYDRAESVNGEGA